MQSVRQRGTLYFRSQINRLMFQMEKLSCFNLASVMSLTRSNPL